MSLDDFTKQFAIRLPDGTLYGLPVYSPASSMLAHMGFSTVSELDEETGEPRVETVVYDTLEEAQGALEFMKNRAKQMGITSWLGRIETRYCTQFSDTNPGEDMMADLESFLAESDNDDA